MVSPRSSVQTMRLLLRSSSLDWRKREDRKSLCTYKNTSTWVSRMSMRTVVGMLLRSSSSGLQWSFPDCAEP